MAISGKQRSGRVEPDEESTPPESMAMGVGIGFLCSRNGFF
jgi:hypothetical protein